MANWIHHTTRLLRHRWAEGRLGQAIPETLIERLTRSIATSELRHTGQVRLCIEAGLPASYLWRGADARERAVAMFSKLHVWDTEQNNGVLIYLLLADHAIEIVADRGLARHVPPETWAPLVSGMGDKLRASRYEEALEEVVSQVTALLEQHFSVLPGETRRNELPDAPFLSRR